MSHAELIALLVYGGGAFATFIGRAFWFLVKAQRLGWPRNNYDDYTAELCTCGGDGLRECCGRAELIVTHAIGGSMWRSFVWPVYLSGVGIGQAAFAIGSRLRQRDLQAAEDRKLLQAAEREANDVLRLPAKKP